MTYIYILSLEQNKYYIGKTDNPHFRIESHFDKNGSAWTKKYLPLKLLELIPDCDNFDEDKYTKIYMNKYGIENVRGGSFCQIELDKSTIDILQKMILSANDKCYLCEDNGHVIEECPYEKTSYDRIYFTDIELSDWIDTIINNNPLFIIKKFLIDFIKVNWFSLKYEDRYSENIIKKNKWKLSVISIKKDIVNNKIDIGKILEELKSFRIFLDTTENNIHRTIFTKDRKLNARKVRVKNVKNRNKKNILNSIMSELQKLKTNSYSDFFDYVNDLLLVDI